MKYLIQKLRTKEIGYQDCFKKIQEKIGLRT